mgnify:CR=1 FL=1
MSDTIDNKIFNFAYYMAFRDATMRNAYPRFDGEDDDHYHKRKQRVAEESKDAVQKYIEAIFDNKQPDPRTVICGICDESYGFTFGNAQKLVNMTAKYMFIASYQDDQKRELFASCDCPMDSVMLGVVKERCPEASWKADFSWSRMTSDAGRIPIVYTEFQEWVKSIANDEGVMPLEVDYLFWDE